MNHKTILPIIVLAIALLVPFSKTHASTYTAGVNNDILVTVNISNQTHPGQSYNQGDVMWVDGIVNNTSSFSQSVSLSAVTVGNSTINLYPAPFYAVPLVLAGNSSSQGLGQTFTVNVPTNPPLPQTFSVNFSAGVDDPKNHVVNSAGSANGPTAIYSVSRQDIKPINVVIGSFPIYDGGSAEFTTEPGAVSIDISVSQPEGFGGRLDVTDSLGNHQCQNNSGADTHTFMVTFNNTTSLTVQLGDGICK